MEKKLGGNYIRMLQAVLNKSWRQLLTKQQLYGHLPPITKTMQIRHMGHYWRSKHELMDEQRLDDQVEPIYSSSVPIQYVVLKTCRERWTIEMGGERGSGKSVLAARYDDEDKREHPRRTRKLFETKSFGRNLIKGIKT